MFGWVLGVLADRGLLKGRRIAIDATTLEANAAMRSIVRRDTGESYGNSAFAASHPAIFRSVRQQFPAIGMIVLRLRPVRRSVLRMEQPSRRR